MKNRKCDFEIKKTRKHQIMCKKLKTVVWMGMLLWQVMESVNC